ncbi:MAG TPA: hypothetical protein VGO93_07935, partial [Candidatus Xenobia bacterium]
MEIVHLALPERYPASPVVRISAPVAPSTARSYSETMTGPHESNEKLWGTPPGDPGVDMNMSVLLLETQDFQVRVDRVTVHAGGITLPISGHGKGTWPGQEAEKGRKEGIDVSV